MPTHTVAERRGNAIEKRRKVVGTKARVKKAIRRKRLKKSGAKFI